MLLSQNLIFSQDSNKTNNKINNLATANLVNGYNDYSKTTYFKPGDIVFIYFEYSNDKSENNFELNIELEVFLDEESYYKSTYKEYGGKNYFNYEIPTEGTWPINKRFNVNINVFEEISKESFQSTIYFTLLKQISLKPKITVLDPASEIRGYKDYDYNPIFKVNNTINIYEEYTNISIINNSGCDLFLELTVTKNDILIYKDSTEKKEIGNNSHKWYFTTNSSWVSGLYEVMAKLTDNISQKETTRITYFTLL